LVIVIDLHDEPEQHYRQRRRQLVCHNWAKLISNVNGYQLY
jgi:hypothetical protein